MAKIIGVYNNKGGEGLRSKSSFDILGIVLNKSDKRTKQYKDHNAAIEESAEKLGCKIFKNSLPPTPKLANATDDSISFYTLSDKYNDYYDHVRKLVIELNEILGFRLNSQ